MKEININPIVYDENNNIVNGVSVKAIQTQKNAVTYYIKNEANIGIKIKEVLLKTYFADLDSQIYGEGYNLIAMYGGTLSKPECTGYQSDISRYKMPVNDGKYTIYNYLKIYKNKYSLLAFTSCYRFRGEFRISDRIEVYLCLENIEIAPGDEIKTEEFMAILEQKEQLVDKAFSLAICKNHPMRNSNKKPNGWCSWYCYGLNIKAKDVENNLQGIKEKMPCLEYILIDDGYEPQFGDWLLNAPGFACGMKSVCKKIKSAGFEPGIWLAPFIATKDSELFKMHPDWFVMDDSGKPLSSQGVTYEGWRNKPWYMLDASNPQALDYLTKVFKIMHEDWGCNYFKLDATAMGALPFGKRYQKNCTAIQAYRMGMQAILDAVGDDTYILGCGAVTWGALGLHNAMRVGTDITRDWNICKQAILQCFRRNYQNGVLWTNDPDCAVYDIPDEGVSTSNRGLTKDEKILLLSAIMAVSGLKFIGDQTDKLNSEQIEVYSKLIKYDFGVVNFINNDYKVATNDKAVFMFNFDDKESVINYDIQNAELFDIWEEKTIKDSKILLKPHSAKVFMKLW